jgi:hypothetical protein
MDAHEFSVDTRRTVRNLILTCAAIEIVFVLLDAFLNVERMVSSRAIRRLVNITREDGLPSFFGVSQTVITALVLWGIWSLARRQPGRAREAIGWLILALFFSCLAIDDGSKLHERVGTAFRTYSNQGADGGWGTTLWNFFPSYAWQVVFGPPLAVMGVFMVVFLYRSLATRMQFGMVISALALLVSAVGLDFVEGIKDAHVWLVEALHSSPYKVRHYSKSLEETIEMFAMTLFLAAFMLQAAAIAPTITLRFKNGSEGC